MYAKLNDSINRNCKNNDNIQLFKIKIQKKSTKIMNKLCNDNYLP